LRALAGLIAPLLALPMAAKAAPAPPSPEQQDCVAHGAFRSGGAQVQLSFDAAQFTLPTAAICGWAVSAADTVSAYFGHFPVAQLRVSLKPMDRDGVSGGTTYGNTGQGALIVIRLGRGSSQAQLDQDWVVVHEMVHLAVPAVPDNSHWLEEGIATYVEPVARAQRGLLDPQRVWADMYRDMRKGLPAEGDEGLDHTATWGRTYWGGALFCLLADVEIHRRSGNHLGLREALRGVLARGGDIQSEWPTQGVFEAGDDAVGLSVLTALYKRLGEGPEPKPAELDKLWKDLGVEADGDGVRLRDDAPLAKVRIAITARRS
jgi:hypothetical protein